MLLGTQNILFGLSVFELAALLAGAAYVVSLVRDWRPMKSLRQENRELRSDLQRANEKIEKLEQKVFELEGRTDLSKLVDHINKLDSSIRANTAAVEVLAKQSAIADALGD